MAENKKRKSTSPSVLNLERLILEFLNGKNESVARIELEGKSIEGRELLKALENISGDIGKKIKDYDNLQYKYEDLQEVYQALKYKTS